MITKQKQQDKKIFKKAPERFELSISCLLDRRFNQLSHGAMATTAVKGIVFQRSLYKHTYNR